MAAAATAASRSGKHGTAAGTQGHRDTAHGTAGAASTARTQGHRDTGTQRTAQQEWQARHGHRDTGTKRQEKRQQTASGAALTAPPNAAQPPAQAGLGTTAAHPAAPRRNALRTRADTAIGRERSTHARTRRTRSEASWKACPGGLCALTAVPTDAQRPPRGPGCAKLAKQARAGAPNTLASCANEPRRARA